MNSQELINKYFKAFDTKEELDNHAMKDKVRYNPIINKIKVKDLVKWIRDNQGKYLYLRYANLEKADLRGLNLMDAYLLCADLIKADLRGTNLEGANFYGANLIKANLEGVNLEGINLENATLKREGLDIIVNLMTGFTIVLISGLIGLIIYTVVDSIKRKKDYDKYKQDQRIQCYKKHINKLKPDINSCINGILASNIDEYSDAEIMCYVNSIAKIC